MAVSEKQQKLLRMIPGVDRILEIMGNERDLDTVPKNILTRCVRKVTEQIRQEIFSSEAKVSEKQLIIDRISDKVRFQIQKSMAPRLVPLINATGVVVHTNLGRSLLPSDALENLLKINSRYSNLEFDIEKGKRGSRYAVVEDILCEISGADSALVVNNNAGAVLICLDTLAGGMEVIVSRGELVEIGGSFRIPDVMAKSGAILKEVGTTNRTHPRDYENALSEKTALLLKVHTSNYHIIGFTSEVKLGELVGIGASHGLPVMEDLGSGTFIDFSRFGLAKEPTVQESVATGADIVTFSGDKLLGGPQAGIIVGKTATIEKIKKNPLNRALRIDKMTLAALESTLRLYRRPENAVELIPTLNMILMPVARIEEKVSRLFNILENLKIPELSVHRMDLISRAGGGSLPMLKIPSRGIGVNVKTMTVNAVERFMRNHTPPIIGRIEDDLFIMDLRTVQVDELAMIEWAFKTMLNKE
ncbi:MAG: L-seryl-tRNA(Sec) selenium transferase [Desulfobacterales bacterium]|nr:L-seryl-tRNA(Sec) selenium transferase [Desulfobacterales bacterium]